MSSINGDKSRAGRQRKTRFEKRERNRLLRKSLTAAPAVVVAPAPVAPSVAPAVAPIVAAAVIVAAVPVAATAHIAAKRPIVQYPKRTSE